jgi:hypothetical protein
MEKGSMKLPLDDVGPGWASILKRLDVVLAAIDPNLEVFQVKEKFGGLRVYVGTSEGKYEAVENAISLAEGLSFRTCEKCGEPGSPGGKGWVKTLCDECRGEGQ